MDPAVLRRILLRIRFRSRTGCRLQSRLRHLFRIRFLFRTGLRLWLRTGIRRWRRLGLQLGRCCLCRESRQVQGMRRSGASPPACCHCLFRSGQQCQGHRRHAVLEMQLQFLRGSALESGCPIRQMDSQGCFFPHHQSGPDGSPSLPGHLCPRKGTKRDHGPSFPVLSGQKWHRRPFRSPSPPLRYPCHPCLLWQGDRVRFPVSEPAQIRWRILVQIRRMFRSRESGILVSGLLCRVPELRTGASDL